jgi:phenylalanyl-tRNA synthetase beta chain
VKNILKADGFSEIYTYGLIGEKDLPKEINSQDILRIDNPVSGDFEYLRPTLKINLTKALSENKPNFKKINLFELGKVYLGKNLDEAKETYFLSGISNSKSYFEIKGLLERIFKDLGVKDEAIKYIEILREGIFFELDFSSLLKDIKNNKVFKPLPKYPPIVEDLSIIADNIKTGELIQEIIGQNSLITDVSLFDQFENSRTFHIIYQSKDRNLTMDEVKIIREKMLNKLKEKFNVRLKE